MTNSASFLNTELHALAHQVSDEPSIVRLFDDCARRFPGRTAIVCGDARVTYAELDARSTTVAEILRALGAGEDEPIALLADASVEMVVAMLATIKAGCAYLPIDPGLPERRIAAILEDSRTKFLLRATECHAGLVCEHVLDLRGALETARAIERLDVVGDLAYIIYTSGTTGTPKGVMVRQRSLVNYVLWFRATYGIDHRAVAPLLTSYAFDLGYTSLWTTLLSGGEVHLVGDELVTNMTRLIAYFRAHQVTFVKLTPSLFHAIVHSHAFAASDSCASLRLVVSGGENIRCEDLRRFYDRYPDALIVNHYGPTETTIGVCTIPIPPRELDAFARRPVIGRPIGGVSAYIVDANLCPLEVGEIGELVIAGVSVARGYLYQPELTAERFITPAFADGEPAYRTGDLARWTHDGTIEFLGRIDRQVKIMGYRIELGEIEGKLQKLDGVQAAIVLPVVTRGDTRQLCAYVVARTRVDQAAMRRQLSNDLPPYMVPAFIVEIDAIPRTVNGKLDVDALPARELAREPRAGSAPITARLLELERTIAAAWQLALDIDSIDELGPDDHFFALGGDSISAALVASQLNSQLGVVLSARAIYDAPTLAQQAGLVQRALAAPAPAREVFAPFDPREHAADEYTPSHEQELYIHRLENDPVAMAGTLNLRFRGNLDLECLRRAIETIHHRHETLRTTFARRGDARIARVQPPTRFDLPVHDLSEGSQANGDAAVFEIVRDQLGQPFDREHGPLMRTVLVRRDARDHHLIFAYCHVNIDRWSIVILMREILDLYCALVTGAPSLLSALPNQYRDYAAWLTRRATAEAVSASLARSRERLRDVPPPRSLATGPSGVECKVGEGAPVKYAISPELLARLEATCKQASCSVATALLATYGATLSHYLGTAVSVDTFMTSPIRSLPEIAPLIGALADVRPVAFARTNSVDLDLCRSITGQLIETTESLTPGIAFRTMPGFHHTPYVFNYRANVPPRSEHALPGVATRFYCGPGSLFTPVDLPELGLRVEPVTYGSATRRFPADQVVFLGINEIDGVLSCLFWFPCALRFDRPTPDELVQRFAANLEALASSSVPA